MRTKLYQKQHFAWNVLPSMSNSSLIVSILTPFPYWVRLILKPSERLPLTASWMQLLWRVSPILFQEKFYVVWDDWFITALVLDLSLFIIFFVKQTHTLVHIITQSCLSMGKGEDGSQDLSMETCNDSTFQKWLLRNYTRAEVFRNVFGNLTDYFP